ncbi:MAG: phosphate ABC transporter permease subunit PstC [Ruminococcus sp.]
MKEVKESIMKVVFLLTACVSILAVALICIFMFAKGLPAIAEIGPADFLLGEKWKPMQNLFGILPMILGSIYVTVGAVIIGVPIAFLAAVYMAKFCNPKVYRIMKPAVGLMAGIPSIVYGFFGLVVIVPIMQDLVGGNGKSMLTASILLGIMILPTVISVAESNIPVPDSYYKVLWRWEATGARSVFTAVLPGAKSGILAGVVLGIGRAVGETMAVIMVAGNQPIMPTHGWKSLIMGVRTLTSNIVMEMGYAADLHREALIATAVVLFVLILIINMCCSALQRRNGQ